MHGKLVYVNTVEYEKLDERLRLQLMNFPSMAMAEKLRAGARKSIWSATDLYVFAAEIEADDEFYWRGSGWERLIWMATELKFLCGRSISSQALAWELERLVGFPLNSVEQAAFSVSRPVIVKALVVSDKDYRLVKGNVDIELGIRK